MQILKKSNILIELISEWYLETPHQVLKVAVVPPASQTHSAMMFLMIPMEAWGVKPVVFRTVESVERESTYLALSNKYQNVITQWILKNSQ